MRVEAVLLDFDGTLVDSNELINQTHLTILEELFPGKYNMESVREFNGPSLQEVYGTLVPGQVDEYVEKYRALNSELHDDMIRLFDGVKEELTRMKEANIQLAIVSTKRVDMIQRGLKILGLEEMFDVIIGAGCYTHFKPHPEPIYRALAELNVPHNRALMVGDNGHDIEAAKNAGIPGVWVEWSQKTFAEMQVYEPDHIVASMKELSELVLAKESLLTSEMKEGVQP